MSIKNNVAVVTGGAQGLGRAICERLAAEGCSVVVSDINQAGAAETASFIESTYGQSTLAVGTNVAEAEQVKALFDQAKAKFGCIDIAVSNAAVLIAEPITEADPEKWKLVMNVNLFGSFLTLRYAAEHMKEQGHGNIIQINSKSGKKGSARNSAYAASKFGGIGLVQSAALELAPYGIRCNAICPGNLLDGPLWSDPQKGLFVQYLKAGKVPGAKTIDDVRKFYTDQVPMQRGCRYEDICNLLVFLASPQSSYMTGQAINVTGGQEMR